MYKIIRLISTLILVATILLLPTSHASAALVRCRTDPIFLLSNGDVINVTVAVSTDAASIRHITYVLHVPAGVTVKRVVYTAINLRLHEMYEVRQDSPTRTYTTSTVVTTRNPHKVEVLSMTRLNGVFAKYVSGYSEESLIVTVGRDDSKQPSYRQ